MLIAEDLLLLLLDERTGRKPGVGQFDKGLAGGLLIELVLLGRVDVAGPHDAARRGRIVLRPGPPPTHPVLAHALDTLAARQGSKPAQVIPHLAKGAREWLTSCLVHAGLLRQEKHRVLGIFPTTRYPAANPGYNAELRGRVFAVLTGAAAPDAHIGPLVSLLHALRAVTSVVELPSRRDARRRARQIAEADWAAAAVRSAIDAVNGAVAASVAASSAATSS